MGYRHLSIVIGEGASMRNGLLRFVLEGEGFEVAAEATTVAELTRAFAVHHPDIVVLDDTLGVAGLELSRRMAPKAKIVLVWPAAVQPIGADARVDPRSVLRELGATVERVAGIVPMTGLTETFDRPDWVGKVRKDPATLREILATGGTAPSRPSVTELQRSTRRMHPSAGHVAAEDGATVSISAAMAEMTLVEELVEVPEAAAPADTIQPLVLLDAPEPEAENAVGPVEDVEPEDVEPEDVEPEDVEPADVEPEDVESEPNAKEGAALTLVEPAREPEPIAPSPPAVTDAEADPTPVVAALAGRRTQDPIEVWNPKLGSIALGAAAVAGTVALSPALGGERTPVHIAGQASGGAITIPGGTSGGGTGGGGTGGGGTGGGGETVTPGRSGDHNPHGGPPGQIGLGAGAGPSEHGNGNANGHDKNLPVHHHKS